MPLSRSSPRTLAITHLILPVLLYASAIDARGGRLPPKCFDQNHNQIECPKKKGLTTGRIVAIVIASVLVLLAIAFLVWKCSRRKRRPENKYNDLEAPLTQAPYDPHAPYDPPKASYPPPQASYAPPQTSYVPPQAPYAPPQAPYAPPPGPPPQGAAASYYNS